MSFARYFKLASYCLITSGFLAIAATGALDIFSLVFFTAALVFSWFADTERLRHRLPAWLLNSIAILYLPIYVLDDLKLSRSFVLTTVHLILFVASVKLLTRATDRDYVYLYLISFAELLAASTLTIDITFAFSLFVFLFSGVCALILFEMKRSHAQFQKQGRIRPSVASETALGSGFELFYRFPAGSVSWISMGMTVAILALAVPLFFLLPRVSLGFYNRPSGQTRMVSGFSETVELGEIGNIKESPAVVMRVKLDDPTAMPPGNLKWRGVALDHYDGRSWSRSRVARVRLYPQGRWFKLEGFRRGVEFYQTYYLEALSTDVVFTCHKALAISGDIGYLERDYSNSFYTPRQAYSKLRYAVVSDIAQPDPTRIPIALPTPPEAIRKIYLQVKDLDPRIANLAREVTQSIPHPYGKAVALEKYLKTHYGYSLELKGTPHSSDPIAMFLFDVRKGHCEYFASAMTIMLRQLGIPARLVNGFRSGEYNPLGKAWTVRQYDAHSWVEAYFPPYEWVEFDPTPPDPDRSRSAWVKVFADLLDAADLWWTEQVVNYDFFKQYRHINSARTQVLQWQSQIRSLLGSWSAKRQAQFDRLDLRRWLAAHAWSLVLTLASGLAVGLLLFRKSGSLRTRLWWMFRRALSRHDSVYVATTFYQEALDLLRAHGLTRNLGQTPLEFADSLGSSAVAALLKRLTEIYNRVRFGSHHAESDLTQAQALLQSMRRALAGRLSSQRPMANEE